MEPNEKGSKLEINIDTDIQDFLREENHIDGRVVGFLNILHRVGKIKTLGDVHKLRDIDVFLVKQFSELSLKRLNKILNKYGIDSLNVDMDKKYTADYRRRIDLERKRIKEKEGLGERYVPTIAEGGSFDYALNQYFSE